MTRPRHCTWDSCILCTPTDGLATSRKQHYELTDYPTSLNEAELYECLSYLPEMDADFHSVNNLLNLPNLDDNPLSYLWLRDMQQSNLYLMAQFHKTNSEFHIKILDDHEIVCYTEKKR